MEKVHKQSRILERCESEIHDLLEKEVNPEIKNKLQEIWLEELMYEEEKSKMIWRPKKETLQNIEEIEKQKAQSKKEKAQKSRKLYSDAIRTNVQQQREDQHPTRPREPTPQPQRPNNPIASRRRQYQPTTTEESDALPQYDGEWEIPPYHRRFPRWRGGGRRSWGGRPFYNRGRGTYGPRRRNTFLDRT